MKLCITELAKTRQRLIKQLGEFVGDYSYHPSALGESDLNNDSRLEYSGAPYLIEGIREVLNGHGFAKMGDRGFIW